MDYKLLSYTALDGIPTLRDSFIRGLFERMQKEGLVERVFYDGSVRTPHDFLNMMKFGKNSLSVIEYDGAVAGCCWLNNFDMRRAEFHFCFFENLRGTDAVDIGKEVVTDLLYLDDVSGNPLFDLLFGMTDVNNVPAVRWCEAMGFDSLGIMPSALWNAELKKSVPAHIWYVERNRYGRKRRKHHNNDE